MAANQRQRSRRTMRRGVNGSSKKLLNKRPPGEATRESSSSAIVGFLGDFRAALRAVADEQMSSTLLAEYSAQPLLSRIGNGGALTQ